MLFLMQNFVVLSPLWGCFIFIFGTRDDAKVCLCVSVCASVAWKKVADFGVIIIFWGFSFYFMFWLYFLDKTQIKTRILHLTEIMRRICYKKDREKGTKLHAKQRIDTCMCIYIKLMLLARTNEKKAVVCFLFILQDALHDCVIG